jgi:phenylacetate-CoA ligase
MTRVRRWFTANVSEHFVWSVVKRSPVLRVLAEWRVRQWDSADVFRRRQDALLADILIHAASRVPFYAKRVPDFNADEARADPHSVLRLFPILTKQDLIDRRDDLFLEIGRGTRWKTSSGTTGRPVRFAQDDVYLARSMASALLIYEWSGVDYGASQVKLWGARRDLDTGRLPLRRRAADWLANRTTLDAFDMTPETMRKHLDAIDAIRPACLEGYVNALYELAVFARRQGIRVRSPGCVISSAGDLLPYMREEMEAAFGARVYDRYGAREVGAVAAECEERDGLHIFGETNVVETIDASGRRAASGEEGELLVTNLWNYTMPLIRYRIGDRCILSDRTCACGRPYPMIEKLNGRSEARVYRKDGGAILPEYFIYLFGVELNDGSIEKFQVKQLDYDMLIVLLVAAPGRETEARAHGAVGAKRIRGMMGASCHVEVELVDRIAPTPTGKHLHVVSHLAGGKA